MQFHRRIVVTLMIALASCGPRHEPQRTVDNSTASRLPAPSAPPAVQNSAPPEVRPKAPADPKSTEAALELAQKFADLLNQRKFEEAYMLLGAGSGFSSAADLEDHFSPYSGLHVTILKSPPPAPEGAAGSIYLSVQANFYGIVRGRRVDHPATITMRRVNDVPGSTAAQRRWHIEGFDDTVM